jgi:hypothetical protein
MDAGSTTPPKFTLLQGVMVGILLILILGIFWPVYTGSRPAARRSMCISNLKQLGTAQLIYAADNSDAIPPAYSFDGVAAQQRFVTAVLPYCKNNSLLLCPESATFLSDPSNPKGEMNYEHFPLILRHKQNNGMITQSIIPSPEKVAWMHEPIVSMKRVANGFETETYHKKSPNAYTVLMFDSHVSFAPTVKGTGKDAMDLNGNWLK